MRFNVAWSDVLSQNVVLRLVIVCLSLTLIGLLAVSAKLALREPIVIERACFSRALDHASTERTMPEITAFLAEALAQRFDTDSTPKDGFLSIEEATFRYQEQKALGEKEMRQRILVNRIEKISGDEVSVDSDRLISVGTVRSALPFPLRLSISSVPRSRGNPYGLKVVRVKPVEMPQDGERKK